MEEEARYYMTVRNKYGKVRYIKNNHGDLMLQFDPRETAILTLKEIGRFLERIPYPVEVHVL